MTYDADWLPPTPDHHYLPGCCDRPQAEHLWSEQESREIGEWLETEPGMRQQLANREAQLARLEGLGAPEIILANQRRLIRETERKLGYEKNR